MSAADLQPLVLGAVVAIASSALFVLALIIVFTVVLGIPKLRPTGPTTSLVRSLDELVGQERYARYLPPDAPRGPADQLRTPELLEATARRSG